MLRKIANHKSERGRGGSPRHLNIGRDAAVGKGEAVGGDAAVVDL